MKRKSPAEEQGSWEEAKASVGVDCGSSADKAITPEGRSAIVKPKDEDTPPDKRPDRTPKSILQDIKEKEDEVTVVVKGFPTAKVQEETLRNAFMVCGKIAGIRVPGGSDGLLKGTAFIQFTQEEDVLRALELDNQEICGDGNVISVHRVNEKIPREGRGGKHEMNDDLAEDSALLSGHPMHAPEHKEADGDGFGEVKEEVEEVETNPATDGPDKEVKANVETDPEKGLAFLTQEERSLLLTMPECLKNEIGMRFWAMPNKITIIRFFERYTQQPADNCDHYFDTQTVLEGWAWQSRLVTPSLYRWTFLGLVCPSKFAAEDSACCTFCNDPRVQEIASLLPPATTRVKKYVTSYIVGPFKKSLRERGISVALLTREARDALFLQFKEMGCRLALWDGNA